MCRGDHATSADGDRSVRKSSIRPHETDLPLLRFLQLPMRDLTRNRTIVLEVAQRSVDSSSTRTTLIPVRRIPRQAAANSSKPSTIRAKMFTGTGPSGMLGTASRS